MCIKPTTCCLFTSLTRLHSLWMLKNVTQFHCTSASTGTPEAANHSFQGCRQRGQRVTRVAAQVFEDLRDVLRLRHFQRSEAFNQLLRDIQIHYNLHYTV